MTGKYMKLKKKIFFQPWFLSWKLIANYIRLLIYLWLELNQLTLSSQRSLPYKNQFSDLESKLMDRFLYDRDLRHEWVKGSLLYPRVMDTNIDLNKV